MVYTYTPTYYTSLHDSITSLCKNFLPFSFKKRRLPAIAAAELRLSKQQSDNLKWQQESFHQILKLMGLCKEGILPAIEVSAFRSHLLETLIASPLDFEQPAILRDKLIFLQELVYAKCISEEEYHCSKRPLLQRLAVQGAEIKARDVICGAPALKENSDEEWSYIDLKDDKCLLGKENLNSVIKSKHKFAVKLQIKGGTDSVLSSVSIHKSGKIKEEEGKGENRNRILEPSIGQHFGSGNNNNKLISSTEENPFWDCERGSILMPGSIQADTRNKKKKPFRTMFQREDENTDLHDFEDKTPLKSGKKKHWGFVDGFKKWKTRESEDETTPLSLENKSDSAEAEAEEYAGRLVVNPAAEGPDTRQIKRKLHSDGSPSDFFIDKVVGENIKKELMKIQRELCSTNPTIHLSNDQIEAISTRLPVDMADLRKFFPKAWCDRYGDVVLDVVRKEFKDHMGEMSSLKDVVRDTKISSNRWATFDDGDDDENCHPNVLANSLVHQQDHSFPMKQQQTTFTSHANNSNNPGGGTGIDDDRKYFFKYNPFFDD